MKVIVGIDDTKRHITTLNLLARLRFGAPETTLVHIIPTALTYSAFYAPYVAENYEEISQDLHKEGEATLETAAEDACGFNLPTQSLLITDGKAEGLASAGDRLKSDLIAVSCSPKSSLERLFTGSVAHGLAVAAHQSLLIARPMESHRGSIRAVFATDHSEYANKCLDTVLGWKPAGISHVTVLTAFDILGHERGMTGRFVAVDRADIDHYVGEKIEERTAAIAQRFSDSGIPADPRTVRGNTNRAIHETMLSASADLLILGAVGHGSWERFRLGSTSLHQVTSETYPILIVRNPHS